MALPDGQNLFVDRFRRDGDGRTAGEARYTDYGELENAQLLSGLPEEERILFTMRYLEGYNSRELGELFGIPPATVRMRLASAKAFAESGRIKGWRKETLSVEL